MIPEFVRKAWREFRTPLYGNAVYLFLLSPVNQASGFVFWLLVARVYPTSDVGLAATAIATIGFLGGLATLGLPTGLTRFLPEAGDQGRAMVNSCLTIAGLAGLLASAVFLLGIPWWAPPMAFLLDHPVFLGTFLVLGGVLAASATMNAAFLALRRAKFIFWQAVVQTVRVPLPLALAAYFGVFGIFGSWALAMVVSSAVALLGFLPRALPGYGPKPEIRRAVVNDLLHYALVNYAAGIVGGIMGGITPLLLVNLLGAESVAFYYVATNLVGFLGRIPGAVTASLFAEGSQPGADFSRDVRRSLRLIVPLLGAGILALIFLGDGVLALFGRAYSEGGLRLLQLLALATGIGVVPGLYGIKLLVEKRLRRIVGLSALGTALGLAAFFAFVPPFGLTGLGIASVAGGCAMAGLTGYLWWTDIRRSTRTQTAKT